MKDRAGVVEALREIAVRLALGGDDRYRARAFERGARALEGSRTSLEDLVRDSRLEDLPGVGPALAREIDALARTGRSPLLERLREDLPAGVVELARIRGVGLGAARALHERLGVASAADLERAAAEGRVRELEGFGPRREAKILDAVRRHREAEGVLTLAEGLRRGEALATSIADLEGVESARVAGALRRAAELVNAIEIVAVARRPAEALERIAALPAVAAVEAREEGAARLRLGDGARVTVTVAPPRAAPTTLVVPTGSRAHVARLEAEARERGLTLAAPGLFREGRPVAVADEDAVYAALGMTPVPPELREDEGEVEAARTGVLLDPVALGDLRGFVHCHTRWSDGRATIEEMARAAEARGASFLTITDHSAAAHYARGLDRDRLERQWAEIEEVRERVGVRILRGTEVDILEDGALDFPDRVLERLDVVIASIHDRRGQDEESMTRRLVRAMRQPVFKIWGHPLGRLLRSRPPIACRVEEVLDALAESRGAVEINGDPRRLDMEPRWARAARERGIPFVLSVDAHSVEGFDHLRYAVAVARRAGIRREEVLNARSAAAFARAVRPAGRRAA